MKTSIVVGDLQGHRDSTLVGATAAALVFEALGSQGSARFSCDRATGEAVEVGADDVVALRPSSAVESQGVRIATRTSGGRRELCRFHGHGWVERAFELAATARLVATDTHVLVIDILQGRPFVWALGAVGPVVTFALPPWVVTDAAAVPTDALWSVCAASQARAIVFVSKDRAAWLAFEHISALYESIQELPPNARVEFCALLPGTTSAQAPVFPAMETRPNAWPTPGSKARDLVTPQVRERISRLAQLGLATTLEGAAVEEAITEAFGRAHMAPHHGAVTAAMILRAHWLAHPPAEDRARLGEDAIASASHANASAGGPRRWTLVMTNNYEPLALALEPAEREAVEREGLLLLEPLPAYATAPKDLASAVAELAALIGAGPDDVVVTEDGQVLLSLIAASTLESRLAS